MKKGQSGTHHHKTYKCNNNSHMHKTRDIELSLDTLTQTCRIGEKKSLPCLPLVEKPSFLGKPPFIPTSSPQNQPNYNSPPLASSTKKKIRRKSRLLMGRGLENCTHPCFLVSLYMVNLDMIAILTRQLLLTPLTIFYSLWSWTLK